MAQRRVTHRNTQTVWLFDFLSFETLGEDTDRLIFLSERDWNMIWQATKDIDVWQSRVWVEAEGENYLTVDDTQFEEFQNWVSDMRIHLGDFAMIEDILQEISDRIQALVDKPCCPDGGTTGSRGTGSTQAPPNPYDQEATPEDPPEGFEDMEAFEGHKCNAAADIVNALQADLLSLSALTYAAQPPTGIVAVLIGILLTPIPYDDMIALAAYLIYTAISYSFLAEMAAQMEEDEQTIICSLYNAATVEGARAAIEDALQEIADAQGWTSPQVAFVMGAIDYFLTNDSLNKLFEDIPTVSQDADCSECEPEEFFSYSCIYAEVGSETQSADFIEVDGDLLGDGAYWFAIGWDDNRTFDFSIVSGSVTAPATGPTFVNFLDDDSAVNCGAGNNGSWDQIYSSFTITTATGPSKTVGIRSGTDFRIRVDASGTP